MKKKTFDAVAFMRRRREELSRAYAGLTAEQIEERTQEALKNDPLWRQHADRRTAFTSGKNVSRRRVGS
jgi:hypothetical protein